MRKISLFVLSVVALLSFAPSVTAQTIATSTGHPLAAVARPQAAAPAGTAPNTTIDFNWQNGLNSGVPNCGNTLKNCYAGDTLTDTTAGIVIAAPAQIPPTVQSFTYTPAGGLWFGTHTFSIVANWYDGTGTAKTTSASTASVTNDLAGLNGPTALQGVPTP